MPSMKEHDNNSQLGDLSDKIPIANVMPIKRQQGSGRHIVLETIYVPMAEN